MLEGINNNIKKLIELYESAKVENTILHQRLLESKEREQANIKQILELEKQVDNLKLKSAFTTVSGSNQEAKNKIEALIKNIDKCILLLEK